MIKGTLRFASGAGVVRRALVTIWLADGTHLLVDADVALWPGVGAGDLCHGDETLPLDHFQRRPGQTAALVGEPGFSLGRRGFQPGRQTSSDAPSVTTSGAGAQEVQRHWALPTGH